MQLLHCNTKVKLFTFLWFSLEAEVATPMSFEDAMFMGRTGRTFQSSPYSRQRSTIVSGRSYELDEEDWC